MESIHLTSAEFNSGGRLDDKDGSQECPFLQLNPSETSSVAMVPVARANVRISVPAFWSLYNCYVLLTRTRIASQGSYTSYKDQIAKIDRGLPS